jgi:hypothetical protein
LEMVETASYSSSEELRRSNLNGVRTTTRAR